MTGGLMQLVAYGAQDVYLTGNPQITFFKVVYRRHTNFSMEAIEQTFNGQAGNFVLPQPGEVTQQVDPGSLLSTETLHVLETCPGRCDKP